MAKGKTKNNNTQNPIQPKNPKFDEYYNILAHQMAPSNNEHKKRLSIALVQWSMDATEPLIIDDFIDAQGIHPDTYYEWLKKYPELKAAHNFARRRLASLRIKNGTTGKWNWAACRWVLPFMDSRYLDYEKDLAAVKTPAPEQGGVNLRPVIPGFVEQDGKVLVVFPDVESK